MKGLFDGSRNVRMHILFSGRVQMVGFRYYAFLSARGRMLGGYVQNLDDGRVEMELEGPKKRIREALKELKTQGKIRVDHMDIRELSPKGEKEFHVIDEGHAVDMYYEE